MNNLCFVLVLSSIVIIFYFYICTKLLEIFDDMNNYNISTTLKVIFRILIILFTVPFLLFLLISCVLFALVMLVIFSLVSFWTLITTLIH